MKPGVYQAVKKNGTIYYRSNITYHGKHISLGSFSTESDAANAYQEAVLLLSSPIKIEEISDTIQSLSFEKSIILLNYRDNYLYIGTPIYLRKNYFSYYLSESEELKFDIDDLFYYSSHKILRRKGHLYVNDYGMQVTLFSRYGIRNHSVCNRDYYFVNGDTHDFRYSNIMIINPYYGVSRFQTAKGTYRYRVKLHINGTFTIGVYSTEIKAAIAYNKAVDFAKAHGIVKNYPENYIETISPKEYADIYLKLKISQKFQNYLLATSL